MSDSRWMQDAVREFHVHTNNPAPDALDLDGVNRELRARLIMEEAIETVEALGFHLMLNESPEGGRWWHLEKSDVPNWPEVIDGVCDLMYVTLGTAVEMGVQLNPFFHEVHRSNMAKGTEKDRHGKTIKPEGWKPPPIKYLFDRLVARDWKR